MRVDLNERSADAAVLQSGAVEHGADAVGAPNRVHAAGVGHDLEPRLLGENVRQALHHLPHRRRIGQNGRDVLEEDAWLWEVRNVADVFAQVYEAKTKSAKDAGPKTCFARRGPKTPADAGLQAHENVCGSQRDGLEAGGLP